MPGVSLSVTKAGDSFNFLACCRGGRDARVLSSMGRLGMLLHESRQAHMTHPSLNQHSLYATPGVPEVWRYSGP